MEVSTSWVISAISQPSALEVADFYSSLWELKSSKQELPPAGSFSVGFLALSLFSWGFQNHEFGVKPIQGYLRGEILKDNIYLVVFILFQVGLYIDRTTVSHCRY